MVMSFLHLVLHQFAGIHDGIVNVIAIIGIICAIGTMAYTGILLGASKGIPFWRSGVVPVIFVISATVTGHFAIMLGMTLYSSTSTAMSAFQPMAFEAAVLVILEILAILFFLQAAYRQPDPRESAERILRKSMFIVGYFILGLAVPFVLMLIIYFSPGSSIIAMAAIGALLGLIGGLILRQAVLICGALPTLNIAGFAFRRIHRPKEPKPDIGMLPPQ
jgi:formate-dependent nitrite reductase membrane component NrfD